MIIATSYFTTNMSIQIIQRSKKGKQFQQNFCLYLINLHASSASTSSTQCVSSAYIYQKVRTHTKRCVHIQLSANLHCSVCIVSYVYYLIGIPLLKLDM